MCVCVRARTTLRLELGRSLTALAKLHASNNDDAAAVQHFLEALRVYEDHDNAPYIDVAETLCSLGGVHLKAGRLDEARSKSLTVVESVVRATREEVQRLR